MGVVGVGWNGVCALPPPSDLISSDTPTSTQPAGGEARPSRLFFGCRAERRKPEKEPGARVWCTDGQRASAGLLRLAGCPRCRRKFGASSLLPADTQGGVSYRLVRDNGRDGRLQAVGERFCACICPKRRTKFPRLFLGIAFLGADRLQSGTALRFSKPLSRDGVTGGGFVWGRTWF